METENRFKLLDDGLPSFADFTAFSIEEMANT